MPLLVPLTFGQIVQNPMREQPRFLDVRLTHDTLPMFYGCTD